MDNFKVHPNKVNGLDITQEITVRKIIEDALKKINYTAPIDPLSIATPSSVQPSPALTPSYGGVSSCYGKIEHILFPYPSEELNNPYYGKLLIEFVHKLQDKVSLISILIEKGDETAKTKVQNLLEASPSIDSEKYRILPVRAMNPAVEVSIPFLPQALRNANEYDVLQGIETDKGSHQLIVTDPHLLGNEVQGLISKAEKGDPSKKDIESTKSTTIGTFFDSLEGIEVDRTNNKIILNDSALYLQQIPETLQQIEQFAREDAPPTFLDRYTPDEQGLLLSLWQEVTLTSINKQFSKWLQDYCAVLKDNLEAITLVEPAFNPEVPDSIAAQIQNNDTQISYAETNLSNLNFEGGNILVGHDCVLAGKSIDLNDGKEYDEIHVKEHLAKTFNVSTDKVYLIGARSDFAIQALNTANTRDTPDPSHPNVNNKIYKWLAKARQRSTNEIKLVQGIYHIDLYLTLAGKINPNLPKVALVGHPVSNHLDEEVAQRQIETVAPELNEVAQYLREQGFFVLRNPLPLTHQKEGSFLL